MGAKHVYRLIHSRKVEPDTEKKGKWVTDSKLIGYFSTMEKAEQTISHYKTITGFKDYPNDFVIEKIKLDFDDYDFSD